MTRALSRASGGVLLSDQGADRIDLLQDLDGNGDATASGERTLFFDDGNASGLPDPAGNIFTVMQAQDSAVYAGDGNTDAVYRLRDLKGDGDAMDAGEATVWFSEAGNGGGFTLPTPNGLAQGPDGAIYVVNAGVRSRPADTIYRTEDLNGDGDAQDAGEATVWLDLSVVSETSAPFELAFIGDVGYLLDPNGSGEQSIWRIEDADGSGAISADEVTRFIGENHSFGAPIDFSLAADATSLYVWEWLDFAGDGFSLYRLTDLDGSGAINAAEEAEEVWTADRLPEGLSASVGFSVAVDEDGRVALTTNGGDPAERFVALLEDRNGDGDFLDDGETGVLGSAVEDPAAYDRPRAVAFYQGPTVAGGFTAVALTGVDAGDFAGISVADAGDADGLPDVLIGAFGANRGEFSNAGETYVFSGAALRAVALKDGAGVPSLADLGEGRGVTLLGEASASTFSNGGWSVSTAGDVDGDGIDDVLVGAWGLNILAGRSYVVYGSAIAREAGAGGSGLIDLAELDKADGAMRGEFDAVDLPGVEKVEIANNQFGLKYRMLRQEPKQKFLVFHDGPEPPLKDNWLLDLQLAYPVFKADQAAIWLAELGLPEPFEDVVRGHMEFYRSKHRIEHLKRLITRSDTKTDVLRRMLAVCAGADGALDTVIEALLGDLAEGRDDALRLIERAGLTGFFWKQVENAYGYAPDEPDFEDFAITLFQSAYRRALAEDGALNAEALLVFRRWKNNRHWGEAFATLSKKYQDILRIPEDLMKREVRALHAVDHFEEVDRHVIRSLVAAMAAQTVSAADVLKTVRARRQSHWYGKYADIYQAIGYATEFQQALTEANLGMTSPEEGVRRYATSWFKLDQLYRKFIYHMQRSGQASLLSALFESVENRYATSFLLTVNDAWQDQVARLSAWEVPGFPRQADFYDEQVAAFRRRDQKVAVIISDALRYEVAEECLREIRKLNRFDAELKPMIGALPSYTQLGMAALLPNKDLTLSEDASVSSFGEPTQGTINREKMLGRGRDTDRMKAMRADAFMALKADDGKQIFRDHDVLYLYHNRIDAMGDKLATEERLPEAAEDAIEDLTKLVRKLTTANFSNILITADHGFLYQHRPLDDAEFSVADPTGEEILIKNRRFVIGRALAETAGMKLFRTKELGLSGELDILIPNSINRMRVKGAGSRFVHGGASLQETIVPVLRVGKQREADIGKVEVQIVVPGRSLISSGQTAVTFYQAQPISEKLHQRELSAGIFAADGTLISDEHVLTFDFSSENPREREQPFKFLLSREADNFNNQDVFLKLRERVDKTRHFEEYASHRFQLRRGITTDFDF